MPITKVQENQQNISRGALTAVKTIGEANVVVATGGLIAVGGYTLTDGDRVLLIGQTVGTENGIYLARAGAWELAEDSEVGDDIGANLFLVDEGIYASQLWQITNKTGAGIVGTDTITAEEHVGASSPNTSVWNEKPSVSNNSFTVTIANDPIDVTLRVYRNGVRQNEGGSNDYTVSGTTITFAKKLKNNGRRQDVVILDYQY